MCAGKWWLGELLRKLRRIGVAVAAWQLAGRELNRGLIFEGELVRRERPGGDDRELLAVHARADQPGDERLGSIGAAAVADARGGLRGKQLLIAGERGEV